MRGKDVAGNKPRGSRPHADLQPAGAPSSVAEIDMRQATPSERAAAERAARLRVDEEMVERILAEGFTGPAWEYVSRELCKYGIVVMRSWLRSGRLFPELHNRNRPVATRIQDAIGRDDHEDIVQEIVARGIQNFRTRILPNRLWSPRGGASITTYFIGQCLIQAPNALSYWYRHSGRAFEDRSADPDLHLGKLSAPEQDVVRDMEADSALQAITRPATRRMFSLLAAGYTQKEIAELLNITPKAVERAIAKGRSQALQAQQRGTRRRA